MSERLVVCVYGKGQNRIYSAHICETDESMMRVVGTLTADDAFVLDLRDVLRLPKKRARMVLEDEVAK